MDFNTPQKSNTRTKVTGKMSTEGADRLAGKIGLSTLLFSVLCGVGVVIWAVAPIVIALIDKLL